MHLPENLLTVFSGEIEERGGTPVVALPEREVGAGTLAVGDSYRVAILSHPETGAVGTGESAGERWRLAGPAAPPVAAGDRREVEIEDVGDQGDGIARVGPGYVVFVPGSDVGDRVTVEITRAEENYAFAAAVEDDPADD